MNVLRLPANAGHNSNALAFGFEMLEGCTTHDKIIYQTAKLAFKNPEIASELLLAAVSRMARNPQDLRTLVIAVSQALDEAANQRDQL